MPRSQLGSSQHGAEKRESPSGTLFSDFAITRMSSLRLMTSQASLIRMLAMKNHRTPEEMLAITNKYALAKEASLDTKEKKKEKELGHSEQPISSKGQNKKGKANHSMNNMERLRCKKKCRPRSSEFEGCLDQISIFHPRESTRLGNETDSKVSHMWCSRWPKSPIKRRSPEIQRTTSLKLTRRSTTSMMDTIPMRQGGSKNSQLGRS
jgi:hypothetical protein